ncbi:MAG TPA: hypothetical protein VGF36_01510 [Rhodopila sp.]
MAINVEVLNVVFPPAVPFDTPSGHVPPAPMAMGTDAPSPPKVPAETLVTLRYSPPPPPPPAAPPAPAPPPPIASIVLAPLFQSFGTVHVVPEIRKMTVTDYFQI